MSAESASNAVDVLGLSVKGASGVTVGTGLTQFFNPSSIGLLISVISFIVMLVLAWEKHKINKLITKELERKEAQGE